MDILTSVKCLSKYNHNELIYNLIIMKEVQDYAGYMNKMYAYTKPGQRRTPQPSQPSWKQYMCNGPHAPH